MRVEVLNCPIDAITMNETIERIDNAIQKKSQLHHVVVNVAKLVHLKKNVELRESVINCDIINADGQGVLLAASLLGIKIPERVAGIDLMFNLILLAKSKGYKIFFLGADDSVLRAVISRVTTLYGPEIIAGFRNGYFSIDEEFEVANEIANAKPDILFVAISTPKKENFLFRNKSKLKDIGLIMGVGGSFDVFAGKVKRAPIWMQKSGLEWFYRFLQEPRRMFYRYFSTNLELILLIVKEKFQFSR